MENSDIIEISIWTNEQIKGFDFRDATKSFDYPYALMLIEWTKITNL